MSKSRNHKWYEEVDEYEEVSKTEIMAARRAARTTKNRKREEAFRPVEED